MLKQFMVLFFIKHKGGIIMKLFVIGETKYSDYIQMKLDQLIIQEQLNPKPYTQEVPILLYDTNSFSQVGEALTKKYGEDYSHFYLLNDQAVKLLNDNDVNLNILGIDEDIEPQSARIALLIRNSRFI
jgi:hypothetical protein